jgi:hypothetical protein
MPQNPNFPVVAPGFCEEAVTRLPEKKSENKTEK